MAVHHGKNGKVKLGSNAVGHVNKWSINQTIDTADTTAMGSAAQTHIVGIPGWSGSADCHYDPADTNGQAELSIGDSVAIGFYSDGDATGKKYFSGTATVTTISIDVDMKSVVKASFNFMGNGALEISTVA